MDFFAEFKTAIEEYDSAYMRVEIVDLKLPILGQINPGEWFRFRIKVHNEGDLDLTGLSVRIDGTASASVSMTQSNPGSSVTLVIGELPAHTDVYSLTWIYGQATAATIELPSGQVVAKDVITAKVEQWNASLDHLLRDHSSWGPPDGKVNIKIYP